MSGTVIVSVIVWLLICVLAGVCLMFAVDIANDEWLPQLRGLGWFHATLIASLIRVALLIPSGGKD